MPDERIIAISCEHVWREISGYIDNEVDPVLRRRMQEHFKKCAHCTAVLDGARNVIRLVGDGRAFEVPHGFGERLKARIAAELGKRR